LAVLVLPLISFSLQAAEKSRAQPKRPVEQEVARQADAALLRALGKSSSLPSLVDDETFLRRVSVDLTGQLPAPEEVRSFVADLDSHKRAKKIDSLLQSDAYAVNWGRYWRDVVTYHTPASRNYLRWQLFGE